MDNFSFYDDLKMKLVNEGYMVYSMINKKNRSKGVTNDFIKYSLWDLINRPTDVVIKTLWRSAGLNEKKYIVISENSKLLNAFKIYKMDTCMLVRFDEYNFELLSTFDSPTFENAKTKIKSN